MKKFLPHIYFLGAFILFVVLLSSFIVNQGENGLLLRLGRLVTVDDKTNTTKILNPGLHFKFPLIDSVRIFDTRIQTLDIKSSRIVTKEKKDVIVDYYVKWKINNLSRYFKATGGNQLKAETLLEQQLNTSLRAQFGKRTISDVVSGGRDDLMDILRERAGVAASGLGIYVVDVRIKGIELPSNTSNAIYQRMRADMQKIANKHRADGQAEAEAIQANADARVTILLAQAKSDAAKIRAKGQALAAKIYADTFNKNVDFFEFYKQLKVYQASFEKKEDILILDSQDPFFKLFKNGYAKKSTN